MLKQGNSNAVVTANNLIKIARGEVPYDRIRGIDISLFDKPVNTCIDDLKIDVMEMIEQYEPRVNVTDVSVVNNRNISNIELNLSVKNTNQEEEDELY